MVCTYFFSGCVICNVTTFHCLEAPKTSNVEGSNLAWVQIRKKWIKISGRIFLWLFSSIKVQIVHWGKILYKVQFSKVDCIINKLNFLSELDDSTIKQDIDKTFLFFFRFWLNLLTLLNSCVLPWQLSSSLIKKWMKNHKVVLLILNPFNGCVSIFCGPKKCKKKNSGKNVDYFLLITSPASLWFMLSSLPPLYNILYYICHVLPFNVMQFCAIMEYGHIHIGT